MGWSGHQTHTPSPWSSISTGNREAHGTTEPFGTTRKSCIRYTGVCEDGWFRFIRFLLYTKSVVPEYSFCMAEPRNRYPHCSRGCAGALLCVSVVGMGRRRGITCNCIHIEDTNSTSHLTPLHNSIYFASYLLCTIQSKQMTKSVESPARRLRCPCADSSAASGGPSSN